jgi:hypothetical protein
MHNQEMLINWIESALRQGNLDRAEGLIAAAHLGNLLGSEWVTWNCYVYLAKRTAVQYETHKRIHSPKP